MTNKRIVIVDDHAFVRLGVRSLLEKGHADWRYHVIEAADGLAGWHAIRHWEPDLVLLDLSLPALDGYELLKRIARLAVRPKVLVLSSFSGNLPVRRALAAGADGYLCKTEATDMLLRAIATVLAGCCFVSRDIDIGAAGAEGCAGRLSARERSIADKLVLGLTNKAIAHGLCLSAKTVSAHKRNIFRKLGVTSLIELADCLRHTDSYGVAGAAAPGLPLPDARRRSWGWAGHESGRGGTHESVARSGS